MPNIHTFNDLKSLLQANFEDNEESLSKFGATYSKQLKAYLVESNFKVSELSCPNGYGQWKKLDAEHWHINHGSKSPGSLILDSSRKRVWILYSLLDASESDAVITKWIEEIKGLDRCWLSRGQLMYFGRNEFWREKGIGLKFSDGLTPEEHASNFSLKAWYGKTTGQLQGLNDLLELAKTQFAIYSTRWQKMSEGSVTISAEWYSNGKVTINRAIDVDEVMLSISDMANRYEDALLEATNIRNNTMGAFELDFTQEIDLQAFSETVLMGRGKMNLWLVETESESDFKRFRGVDLHTWDRIFMDVGLDYAYITIPGKGCVNAAPRIATVQGEDNAGRTSIYFDGVEIFA
ncbi:MAG: Uncharacterized protein XE11_2751 [Methanomicrobiales archaeon 53_19]|nr:MAG: Uncharacterized protein XE11_2751 [Methanomicrobiales archaeon 53_19]